jgi:hypothetical protein
MVKYGATDEEAAPATETQEEPSPKDYTYAARQEQRLLGSFSSMPQLQAQHDHPPTFPMQDQAEAAAPCWTDTADVDAVQPVSLAAPSQETQPGQQQPCGFIATDFDMSFFDVPDMSLFNPPLFSDSGWTSSFSFTE